MVPKFFLQTIKHLRPLYYKKVRTLPTFIYLKSYFPDPWCSFLVPTVGEAAFDWEAAEALVAKEKSRGIVVSYYIPAERHGVYKDFLKKKGYELLGDDCYLVFDLNRKIVKVNNPTVEQTIHDDLALFSHISEAAFPNWNNNMAYCKHLFEMEDNEKQFFLKKDGEVVSIGAMLVDDRLKMAYLHNLATIASERRKGYFRQLLLWLVQMAKRQEMKLIYTIAETGSPSYQGFIDIGFKENGTYFIYAK